MPERIPEGKVVAHYDDETIQLELPDLELSAQLQTYQQKGDPFLIERLGVWLNFDTGDELLTIDPGRILIVKNERELKPMTYIGPEKGWYSPRAGACGCGPKLRGYGFGGMVIKMMLSVDDIVNGNVEKGIFKPSGKSISFKGEK